MPSEKNVVREGGLWSFKSRCQNIPNSHKCKFMFIS